MKNEVIDLYKVDSRGRLDRIAHTVKEYFGPVPMLSGVLAAGAIQVVTFALGAAYQGSNGVVNFLKAGGNDPISAMYNLPNAAMHAYFFAKDFSANWSMPGFLAGQFLGYEFKQKISSIFRRKR